ncbi:MAG: hypothetical protein ACO1N7_11200 [Sphingobacteriaceae bacterium]
MILKSYTSDQQKHKLSSEQYRRYDIVLYLILTLLVLALSVYSSL